MLAMIWTFVFPRASDVSLRRALDLLVLRAGFAARFVAVLRFTIVSFGCAEAWTGAEDGFGFAVPVIVSSWRCKTLPETIFSARRFLAMRASIES